MDSNKFAGELLGTQTVNVALTVDEWDILKGPNPTVSLLMEVRRLESALAACEAGYETKS